MKGVPVGVVGRADDADRLPVVVRFPAGPQVSLKCGDQSKDNGAGHKKKAWSHSEGNAPRLFGSKKYCPGKRKTCIQL